MIDDKPRFRIVINRNTGTGSICSADAYSRKYIKKHRWGRSAEECVVALIITIYGVDVRD